MSSTFNTGNIVITRPVFDRIAENTQFAEFVTQCLSRYTNQDWGDLSEEDARMNDSAVSDGSIGILAAYEREAFPEDKIWIITEWDRSVTTVLFPSDY